MKKIYFALAAVAAFFAGCSNEVEPEQPTPVIVIEKNVSLSASVGDPLTKVSSDNAGIFKWQSTDKITAVTNGNAIRQFEVGNIEAAGTSAEFNGSIPDGSSIAYALYPASESHNANGDNITFHLDENVTWKADASGMPMIATVVGDEASFKSVGGVLKLILFNIPADADYLKFSASTQITGDFNIADASVKAPVIATSTSDGNNELVIDFSANYSASKVFYIPLPTGTIDGFTVSLYENLSDADPLFSVTSQKKIVMAANKLIIAPVMNCAKATVLWSEDFSTFSNNAVPSGSQESGVTYACTNGTKNGSTKIYGSDSTAGGTAPELLVCKYSGTFTVTGIPTGGASSMVLKFKKNAQSLTVSTPSSISLSGDTSTTTAGEKTVNLTNEGGLNSFDLTFTGPSGNTNVRLDDIVLSIPGTSFTAPSIDNHDVTELTIEVGSLEASTDVTLEDEVDGLGISCKIDYPDENKWIKSAVVENDELIVTAKAANSTDSDYTATVTLKATGATAKVITVTQKTSLVPNPTNLVAVAGNATVDVTWTGDEHATSYVAYLHTAETDTPATGGTNITSSIDNEEQAYIIDDYTSVENDQLYYLYIKVNEVATNYTAPTTYAVVTFTPQEAKGTSENPYLASELYDLVSGYSSGGGPGIVYVKGYVSKANNPSSNSQTYYISDDGTNDKQFELYKGKGISGADITESNRVNVGDWVVVSGTAINYNGNTPEFTAGSIIITHYPKLAAPTFSPAAGTYYSAQSVTISAADGATIYYTTEESATPTTESTPYTGAINVSADMTIKAIAVKANCVNSDVAEAAYGIETPVQLGNPAVTCTAHGEDFLTFAWETVTNGIDGTTEYSVSLDGGSNWEDAQTTRTYTWNSLTANTSYTIKVKALGTNDGHYLESVTPGSCTHSTDAVSAGWKETALSDISAGDVFVIVGNNGSNYAMSNDKGTGSAPSAVAVTISGTKLTGSEGNNVIADKIKWNVSGNASDGYVFYPNGSTTTWLYTTTGNNGLRVGDSANKTIHIADNGYMTINDGSNTRYIGIYNSADWRSYTSNGGNIANQTFKFYKYIDNTPRTITVSTPSNGTVTTDPSGTTTAGTTVNITATPSIGYSVRTVSVVDGNSAAVSVTTVDDTHYRFSMPSSDATVTVTFGIKSAVNIAYGTDPAHGSISISPASPVFAGETVTVTATPDDGYELSALTYNDGSDHNILSGKTFTMPASDVTVTATFGAVATISVTNPITNVSATAGTYTINNAYTLLNNATSANVTVAEPDNTVVTAVSKGASDGSISITVSGNTGSARNGSFKIKYGDEAYRTITVNQLAGSTGGTVSFAPSDFTGQGTSGTGSAISATKGVITFACDKGYGTTQFRCYKDGTITISSDGKTITAVSFTFSGSYTGGLSTSYTNLSTTSWTQKLGSQARITALSVTYE